MLPQTEEIKAKLRILIAEDDIDDQEIIMETLLEINPDLEIEMVSNGLKVLEALERTGSDNLPHLIILDYNMPELDGAQVLEALGKRPQFAAIPKVMLSTSSSPYYKATCQDLGAKGYFTKPSSYDEMETLIRSILQYCLPHSA